MEIRTLDGTPSFLALDLPDAPRAFASCRMAPKVLRDGAQLLARSLTYSCAVLGVQASGASIGISAKGDARDGALEGLLAAVDAEVAAGTLLIDPAKGVSEAQLAPLRAADPRPSALWGLVGGHRVSDLVVADGVVAAVHVALGGLEGRRAVVEVTSPVAVAVVDRLVEVGVEIVAVGGAGGAVRCPDDAGAAVRAAIDGGAGVGLAAAIDGAEPVDALHQVDADVLVIGSRAGVLDHEDAAAVPAAAIVPHGPVPVSTRALAVLRRREVVVVPGFVSTAGAIVAAEADPSSDAAALRGAAAMRVGEVLAEVAQHDDGAVIGACERAETFLATWQDEAPFGRPLA